jgi:uncharacterized repeat protein (TIGR01451 family)
LNNGTSYPVRLRAVNAVGAGAASNSVAATPRSTPGAPTITSVTAGDQQISVSFTAPVGDGGAPISNYEYSTDNGTSWTARTPASTGSPLVIAGLVSGATYSVRLRAVNAAGAGPASAAVDGGPAAPDLALTVAADDLNPRVGQTITVTVTLTNRGAGTATEVALNGVLDNDRLAPMNITVSQGTYNAVTGTWLVGNMGPGAVATLTFQTVIAIPQGAGVQ